MPSVVDFADGARFTVRVRTSLTSNRRVRWFNTWECRSTSSGGIDDITALAGKIEQFHALLSWEYVTIDEVAVASWEPDSHPYNPLTFVTYAYNEQGVQALGLRLPVALRQTLFLKRTVVAGLQGKLFLRGVLTNEDLAYGDGEWQLASPSALQVDVNNAITTSEMSELMLGIDGLQFSLCMMGDAGETRFLEGLTVGGTSDVKLNHKYFDRAP